MEIYQNQSLEDLPNETWKDIPNYEGLYQVSNLGRVKSLERQSSPFYQKGTLCSYSVKEKICKQYIVMGYLMVHLSKNDVKTMYKVHRVVASAFIPNINNCPQVNHLDENKFNNSVDNLEWCTCKQNNNHGTRNERISKTQRNNPKFSKRIMQYTLDGEFVKEWESICEAGRAGYDRSTISNLCNKEKGTHAACGYLWKFSNDKEEIKPYKNPAFKPILCYSISGEFIQEFPSIKEACTKLGLDTGAVSWCCIGRRKSHKGYTFKYK